MSEQPGNRQDEMDDDKRTEVMTAYAVPEDETPEVDDAFDEEEYDEFGDDASLPGRPRRALVNRYSVGLVVILVGAGCFYGGVRVEKSKVGTSGAAGGLSGLTSRFAAASGTGGAESGAASRRGGAAGFGATSGAFPGGGAGFAGGGAGGAAAAGTEGTIASIDGDTLYVTESSGNTVKVKLTDVTTLTKTVTVGKRSLYPGDTVSVSGASTNGTVSATSVADSGASTSSSSSSSGTSGTSGSTSSSTSGSSGLSSLFGGN